jgi:hypothetical protein
VFAEEGQRLSNQEGDEKKEEPPSSKPEEKRT